MSKWWKRVRRRYGRLKNNTIACRLKSKISKSKRAVCSVLVLGFGKVSLKWFLQFGFNNWVFLICVSQFGYSKLVENLHKIFSKQDLGSMLVYFLSELVSPFGTPWQLPRRQVCSCTPLESLGCFFLSPIRHLPGTAQPLCRHWLATMSPQWIQKMRHRP